MLTPSDVVSAKLIVQMNLLPHTVVQQYLYAVHTEQGYTRDLIDHLLGGRQLEPAVVPELRRLMALFQHVFQEAVFLREAERRGLTKQGMHDVLARVEMGGHVQRIGEVLVDTGRITVEDLWQMEEVARRNVYAKDRDVLERYLQQRFAGIVRPLIPGGVVNESAFRLSRIFRDADTHRAVQEVMLALREEDTGKIDISKFRDTGVDTVRIDTTPLSLTATDLDVGTLAQRTEIGPYRIMECLGSGGMGAVYMAQMGVGEIVAVKVLRKEADPDDLARLSREAYVCSLLEHENTVRLIDYDQTEDGLHYLVIPAYPSTPLRDVMNEEGALSPNRALEIFEQTLEALDCMHSNGVVHRDVKPENILLLVGPQEKVKLVDYGIARVMDDQLPPEDRQFRTTTGLISGSPRYIAPETIVEDRIDGRTDMYSLAVVLFEMLTGHPPFRANEPAEFLQHHLMSVPPSLSLVAPDTYWPAELESLIGSLLAKKLDDRPPSCHTVLSLLWGGLRKRIVHKMQHPPKDDDRLFMSFEG